ncbi:MAG: patatin-like phospholipase family protein [Chloroflexi bacterium]|jgi:NTE family protein|nr:patatin-like phospholipase family protein [Chloroflexota bacterium]
MTRKGATRAGLALGGGGSKGAFQAGAIATLVGELGFRPDVIAGTSAGSLNTLILAHATTPDEYPEIVDRLLAAWTTLADASDVYLPRAWVGDLPPSLRRAAGDAAAGRLGPAAVLEVVRSAAAIRRAVGDFRSAGDSVYSLAPVETRVRAEIEPDRVRASRARIRISAVALETGTLRWVDEAGRLYAADATTRVADDPVDLVDAVLASSAFSPAFPPRRMAGETYVDGGFRTVLPVRGARAAGAGPVVAVACASAGVGSARPMADANVIRVALRAASATLAEVAARDVEDLRRGPGLLVDPTVDVHGFLEVDPGRIAIDIDLGRMVAAERVEAVGGLERILAARRAGTPDVEDPAALALTDALTRAVVRLRVDAWADEERLLEGRPRADAAAALAAVRARKWLLRHAVAARAARPGPMPPGSDGWWRGFERHAGRPVLRDPWAGLSERNGGPVPAVDADAFVPGPFTMADRESGERWRVVAGRRRPSAGGEPGPPGIAGAGVLAGAPGPGGTAPLIAVDRSVLELVPEA